MKPNNTPQYIYIPAQPGWFEIEPVIDDGKVSCFIEEPIIAWEVSAECPQRDSTMPYSDYQEPLVFVTPVTVGGRRTYDKLVLRRPNGTLTSPEDREYDNMEEVQDYLEGVS